MVHGGYEVESVDDVGDVQDVLVKVLSTILELVLHKFLLIVSSWQCHNHHG